MATVAAVTSSSLLRGPSVSRDISRSSGQLGHRRKARSLTVRAAKLPAGVEMPKVEPKLTVAFWGFTTTAEIWNSRACMIGLIGTFIAELILHRGILTLIGWRLGKA
ncbi:unnamed protein product [Spirodela intermedia]|uniref:Uncharacterized protein n=1 Tax=Spirodela intermedia TaxID=51605 RepID=A0A7I8IVR9_SPIIN|nr:unnamed protein product [Spirodela intermedia]CAA6661732.1 unnamed protein product [Spirodela intermedia]